MKNDGFAKIAAFRLEGEHVTIPHCGGPTSYARNASRYIVCTVDLRQENPVAKRFLQALGALSDERGTLC